MRRTFLGGHAGRFLVASLIILLACASCSREDFSLLEEQSGIVVSVDIDDSGIPSQAGHALSLFVDVGSDFAPADLQFSVVSPDGVYQWEFFPSEVIFDDVRWLGYPNLALGSGVPIPEGEWILRLFLKDGRTLEHQFHVSYVDPDPSLYPIFLLQTSDAGVSSGKLVLNGIEQAEATSLLDSAGELNDTLLSAGPFDREEMLGQPDTGEPVVPVLATAPESWTLELFDASGVSLYRSELEAGTYYALSGLGGETLWDQADSLAIYRYLPELRVTLVSKQRFH